MPFFIFFGSGYGGARVMAPILVREFFGKGNFAIIVGFILGLSMLGNITGPPLAGWVFDTWGSYQGIWFVLAGMLLIAIISIITTPTTFTNYAGYQPK